MDQLLSNTESSHQSYLFTSKWKLLDLTCHFNLRLVLDLNSTKKVQNSTKIVLKLNKQAGMHQPFDELQELHE